MIAERNKRIESSVGLVQEWYDDNGYLVFYTWGDIDRDAMDGNGRMSIQFIAYAQTKMVVDNILQETN